MAGLAGLVQAVAVVGVGAIVGSVFGGVLGAAVGGGVSLLAAVPYGLGVARGRCYRGAAGLALCLVDATWSALNTWAGAWYYGVHRLTGNTLDVARSEGAGSLWLQRGVVAKYATTIGIVKAGSNAAIDDHENIHILQARLFGPLYLPSVALNYVIATLVPYWLLFSDRSRWPVTGFTSYFEHGVYPHVWNELWAYKAAP